MQIAVGHAGLDLKLRHRPLAESDVASLEKIRDRVTHTLESSDAAKVDTHLRELRTAAELNQFSEAARTAERLRDVLQNSRSLAAP